MEEIEKRLSEIEDIIDSAKWDLDNALEEIFKMKTELEVKDSNTIKDINTLKRELKRDGLYTDKIDEFLDNFMRFYNK